MEKNMERPKLYAYHDFVGLNADHYIGQWKTLEAGEKRVLWHWRAFLFAPFWLAGRKLYFHSFLYFLILFFGLFFGALLKMKPVLSYVLFTLPYDVFIGLSAYPLYLNYCTNQLTARAQNPKHSETAVGFVKKHGGVSLAAGFAAIALFVLVAVAAPDVGTKFIGWLRFGSDM